MRNALLSVYNAGYVSTQHPSRAAGITLGHYFISPILFGISAAVPVRVLTGCLCATFDLISKQAGSNA
jgi:hypothetical protein